MNCFQNLPAGVAMNMRNLLVLTILLILISFYFGCGVGSDSVGSPQGGNYGLTPGGAQDFAYIRSLINNGQIPNPENFVVEGLLSEYDLPLEDQGANQEIEINCSYGYSSDTVVPYGGMYVQFGFSSNIEASTFHRDPLNLSIVLDKSGSMQTGSASPEYNKIVLVKEALCYLVDQLGEDDLLSIVLFNENMSLLREPAPVIDKALIKSEIRSVYANGSTNLDVGLREGFELVRDHRNETRSNRVILLTDAMANTGNFTLANFSEVVTEGTEYGIDITSFGVGLDFNQELIDYISTTRGANYFYLNDIERVQQLFVEDFELMVTPVAYDLQVEVTPSTIFYLDRTYGFPSAQNGEVSLSIATLFLSRGSGATLLHFELPENNPLAIQNGTGIANLSLTYANRNFEQFTDEFELVFEGPGIDSPDDSYYDQESVRKAIALAREVQIMQEACLLHYEENNSTEAIGVLNSLVTYLEGENEHFGEDFFADEIALVNKLIQNID